MTRPLNIASYIFIPVALLLLFLGGLLLYYTVVRRSTVVFDRDNDRIMLSEGHDMAISHIRHVGVHRREYIRPPYHRWDVEVAAKGKTLAIITGLDRERARTIAETISQYLQLHVKEY